MENLQNRSGIATIQGYPAFDENRKRRLLTLPYYTLALAFLIYAGYLYATRGGGLQGIFALVAAGLFAGLVIWRLNRKRQLILRPEGLQVHWANDRGRVLATLPYPQIASIAFYVEGKAKAGRRQMQLVTTGGQAYNLQMDAQSVIELQTFLSAQLRQKPTALQWTDQAGGKG